jgi:hypothetical protein
MRPDGSPALNPYFVEAFTKKFVNKMSRVIICCQDGEARSELAGKMVTDAGFTSVAVVAGGMDAYFAVSPLTDKDKKARISKVVQPQAGVKVRTRYGYISGALAPCLPACSPFLHPTSIIMRTGRTSRATPHERERYRCVFAFVVVLIVDRPLVTLLRPSAPCSRVRLSNAAQLYTCAAREVCPSSSLARAPSPIMGAQGLLAALRSHATLRPVRLTLAAEGAASPAPAAGRVVVVDASSAMHQIAEQLGLERIGRVGAGRRARRDEGGHVCLLRQAAARGAARGVRDRQLPGAWRRRPALRPARCTRGRWPRVLAGGQLRLSCGARDAPWRGGNQLRVRR